MLDKLMQADAATSLNCNGTGRDRLPTHAPVFRFCCLMQNLKKLSVLPSCTDSLFSRLHEILFCRSGFTQSSQPDFIFFQRANFLDHPSQWIVFLSPSSASSAVCSRCHTAILSHILMAEKAPTRTLATAKLLALPSASPALLFSQYEMCLCVKFILNTDHGLGCLLARLSVLWLLRNRDWQEVTNIRAHV